MLITGLLFGKTMSLNVHPPKGKWSLGLNEAHIWKNNLQLTSVQPILCSGVNVPAGDQLSFKYHS